MALRRSVANPVITYGSPSSACLPRWLASTGGIPECRRFRPSKSGHLPLTSGPPWLAGAITEEIVDVLRPVTQPTAAPGLTAVLEGNIAKAGDRVHITATLSRPDGHRYWTRTFELPLDDDRGRGRRCDRRAGP